MTGHDSHGFLFEKIKEKAADLDPKYQENTGHGIPEKIEEKERKRKRRYRKIHDGSGPEHLISVPCLQSA